MRDFSYIPKHLHNNGPTMAIMSARGLVAVMQAINLADEPVDREALAEGMDLVARTAGELLDHAFEQLQGEV